MRDAFLVQLDTRLHPRFGWLRPGSPLGRARLGLLAALTVLTGAAWALTVYQALSMNAPMEGMSDMAMSGMPAAGWSFASAGVFLGGMDCDDGRDDAPRPRRR